MIDQHQNTKRMSSVNIEAVVWSRASDAHALHGEHNMVFKPDGDKIEN